MNIFFEFYKIAKRLHESEIPYALVGGVAMAFYTRPRFTKDIDLLIYPEGLVDVESSLRKEGYTRTAPPWTFSNTALTLHHYLKVEGDDEMMMDVLVARTAEHQQMIDEADIATSDTLGEVRVIRKKDLIRLKQARNSKLDQADIEQLEHE